MRQIPCQPGVEWTSEHTLRVSLGDTIGEAAHQRVRAAVGVLEEVSGLLDLTPAYTTVLLSFDPVRLDPAEAEARVRDALVSLASSPPPPGRAIEIPVCYSRDLAPDLGSTAEMLQLAEEDLVARHCGAEYTAQFLGFSPGFAYLAGLPSELHAPRLDRPRPRVPAGAVGIAGAQTGVYPRATPGGWRLIGRTPLSMFDPARADPSLLRTGDRVRFIPIDRSEFDRLSSQS